MSGSECHDSLRIRGGKRSCRLWVLAARPTVALYGSGQNHIQFAPKHKNGGGGSSREVAELRVCDQGFCCHCFPTFYKTQLETKPKQE